MRRARLSAWIVAVVVIIVIALLVINPPRSSSPELPSESTLMPREADELSPPVASDVRGSAAADPSRPATGSDSSDPSPTSSNGRTSLEIRLVSPEGRYLPQGEVLLYRGGVLIERSSIRAKQASARFDDIDGGDHFVIIDPASLPSGYLPPRAQSQPHLVNARDHLVIRNELAGIRVSVPQGSSMTLDLRVDAASFVHGFVRAVDGAPVRSAHVSFACAEKDREAWTSAFAFDTDVDGHFEGYIYPGRWLAAVNLGPSNKLIAAAQLSSPSDVLADGYSTVDTQNHPLKAVTRPLPRICYCAPASSTEVSFVYGGGEGAIVGRVTDQNGAGFDGLKILVCPLTLHDPMRGTSEALGLNHALAVTTSGPAGGFRFDGLESGHYRIQVTQHGVDGVDPLAPPGKSLLGRVVPPSQVDVTAPSASELEITATRAAAVLVRGTVTVDQHWALAHQAAQLRPRAVLVLPKNEWRARDARLDIALSSADGTFSFYVDVAQRNVLLELSLAGELVLFPIDLQPSVDGLYFPIRFP